VLNNVNAQVEEKTTPKDDFDEKTLKLACGSKNCNKVVYLILTR